MKRFGLLLGMVAVLALVAVGSVFAEEAKAPPVRPAMGAITKIEGKTLTFKSPRQDATEQTATVDDATEITKEAAVKLEDVKVGDRVRITQGETRSFGEVAKVDGKTLTLKDRRGTDQTVTVDDKTVIMGTVKAKFEELKVGQFVAVTTKDGKTVRVDMRTEMGGMGGGKKKGGAPKEEAPK